MTQYIDKSALVAEIDKRINFNKTLNAYSRLDECKAILSFIDTLEVKEVDLEKEIEKVKKMQRNFEFKNGTIIEFCSKHFFELGLKAQKGE